MLEEEEEEEEEEAAAEARVTGMMVEGAWRHQRRQKEREDWREKGREERIG